jgi:hypothetical protein
MIIFGRWSCNSWTFGLQINTVICFANIAELRKSPIIYNNLTLSKLSCLSSLIPMNFPKMEQTSHVQENTDILWYSCMFENDGINPLIMNHDWFLATREETEETDNWVITDLFIHGLYRYFKWFFGAIPQPKSLVKSMVSSCHPRPVRDSAAWRVRWPSQWHMAFWLTTVVWGDPTVYILYI